jgi:hypothetical protein
MRLLVACPTCVHDSDPPDHATYRVPVEDSGFHRLTCRHGHKTATCFQALRFEVLAELAATAIVDGYYREAISSFASSLERFYEFYLALVFEKRDLDARLYSGTWRHVSRHSERQLGAFLFQYAVEEQKAPPMLAQRYIALRNEVVHKGKIPTRNEAMEFGQAVIDYLAPILGDIAATDSAVAMKLIMKNVISIQQRHGRDGETISTMSMPTAIRLLASQEPLSKSIERIDGFRRRWS